jgi:hypothetical protein
MERSRVQRYAWLWFLLLQLSVPSLVVLADATTLAPQPTSKVHIETDDCAPSHPFDCRLCSFLRTPVEVPDPLPTALPTTAATPAVQTKAIALVSSAVQSSPLPRAPPTLL